MYTTAKVSFASDYSVYAVVTADEKSGNLYKNVFIQDSTGAINMRLLNSGGLYQGDSIRIYLKGTILSKYNGVLQLDSVDVDKNVTKLQTLVSVTPQTVTIDQILNDTLPHRQLQSKLVKLENVVFKCSEFGKTFADKTNLISENRYITWCDSGTSEIIVRTSGYANFAGEKIPEGNGSLVAIVSEASGGTKQLYLRSFSELNLTGSRCWKCPALLNKDFEDGSISSGGWTMQNVIGNINWTTNSQGSGQGGTYYAQCSNYSGGNISCETWLISPSVNLTGANTPVLSFSNAYKYTGTPLTVLVSTDYSGGLPSSATWTALSFTASSGNFAWVNSGKISLNSFTMSNVHIAFKYTGTSNDGSTWEIDDIIIQQK